MKLNIQRENEDLVGVVDIRKSLAMSLMLTAYTHQHLIQN